MRKYSVPQRAPVWPSMTTEYQDSFISPCCHGAIISTTTQKNPNCSLKGTSADITTFKSSNFTHKWVKNRQKVPESSMAPKDQRRCSPTPHNLTHFEVNQLENYTSVYKNDFRAWKTNRLQPYHPSDSFEVNQGLVVAVSTSKEGRSQKYPARVDTDSQPVPPFESITSYRSDYITHTEQPSTNRGKPVQQIKPAASLTPSVAWENNQEPFNEASKFFKHFEKWSLETKFHGQGKAEVRSPPADRKFVSTTHADYTPCKCQRTKPILPTVHIGEKCKEPLQATTTMKDDYKAWNTPRRTPIVHKEDPIWSKKTPCSERTCAAADSWKTNPKPFNPQAKINVTAACRSRFTATVKPHCPTDYRAFSGFGCISNGNEKSRIYWSTCMDRTCPDSGEREDPSQTRIHCMISSEAEASRS